MLQHTQPSRHLPAALAFVLPLALAATHCGLSYAADQPQEAPSSDAQSSETQSETSGAAAEPAPGRNEAPADALQAADSATQKPPTDAELLKVGPVQLKQGEQGEQGDSATIEFTVEVTQGRRFAVYFGDRLPSMGARAYHVFDHERRQPATVRIEFNRRDAERDGPLLLSKVKILDYHIETEGASPSNASSIVHLPLGALPPGEKQIRVLEPESPIRNSPHGIRLLLIAPQGAAIGSPEEVEKLPECGELVISLLAHPTADEVEVNRSIARGWDRLEHGIGSAEIRYRRFRHPPGDLRALSTQEVRAAIVEAGLDDRPEKALDVVYKLATKEMQDRLRELRNAWRQGEFRALGIKTYDRIVTTEGKELVQEYYDGEVRLSYNASRKRVHLYDASKSPRDLSTLRDFVFTLDAEELKSLSIDETDDMQVVYTSSDMELAIERGSGFVQRFTASDAEHHVSSEIFQFEPMHFTGGIVLPRLKMAFYYENGVLTGADIILIDEAHINEPIDPDGFVILVPPDAYIYDGRRDVLRPHAYRADRANLDALAIVTGDIAPSDSDRDNATAADAPPALAAAEPPAAALPVNVEPSERERLLQERVSVLRQKVDFVELLRRQGSGSPLDSSASRLELARAEAALAEERGDADAFQAALDRAVSSAEEGVDVARRQFQNAELSQVVVLDAENELLKARIAVTTQRQPNREKILQEHVAVLQKKAAHAEALAQERARGGTRYDAAVANLELAQAEAALAESRGALAARNAALAQAVTHGESAVELRQQMYDIGRVTLDSLLKVQNELLKARLAAAEAGVEIDPDATLEEL